jgi:hypothetical protein
LHLLVGGRIGALVVEHAKRIAGWIAEVHGEAHDDDFEAIVEYILQATKDRDLMPTIHQYVNEQTQESLMSVGEWLRASGKAEGEARGRAELLLQLLHQRFGRLSRTARARIHAGTIPELERWASRLLTAASLGEVFAEPPNGP